MFPLVILGALVLGPIVALSAESGMIKRRRRRESEERAELLRKQREGVADTLMKGH